LNDCFEVRVRTRALGLGVLFGRLMPGSDVVSLFSVADGVSCKPGGVVVPLSLKPVAAFRLFQSIL
jgi:hypothetical protein